MLQPPSTLSTAKLRAILRTAILSRLNPVFVSRQLCLPPLTPKKSQQLREDALLRKNCEILGDAYLREYLYVEVNVLRDEGFTPDIRELLLELICENEILHRIMWLAKNTCQDDMTKASANAFESIIGMWVPSASHDEIQEWFHSNFHHVVRISAEEYNKLCVSFERARLSSEREESDDEDDIRQVKRIKIV